MGSGSYFSGGSDPVFSRRSDPDPVFSYRLDPDPITLIIRSQSQNRLNVPGIIIVVFSC